MPRSVKDWSPLESDVMRDAFGEFMDAYVEAALWASMDESDPNTGGDPLDANYTPSDIDPETLDKMEADAWGFLRSNWGDIREDISHAGHDFWLTRNGHGVGFWEKGDWPEEAGERLTEASEAYGEYYLYVGDDGKIYGQ